MDQELIVELLDRVIQQMVVAPPEDVSIIFDDESDELFVNLVPGRFKAISVPVHDHIYIRVSPDRSEVYGVQFENFLSGAVVRYPMLQSLANSARARQQRVNRHPNDAPPYEADALVGFPPVPLAYQLGQFAAAVGGK